MDPDAEILTKVSKIEKFFESVLYKDSLEDWNVAKDLGELLIRMKPLERNKSARPPIPSLEYDARTAASEFLE